MKKIIFTLFLSFLLLSLNVYAAESTSSVNSSQENQAPAIKFPTANGEVQLTDFKDKVVYLDFWASWCLPCKKSFPWMRDMKKRYADQGFEILAVNLDKDKALADEFLQQMDVNFVVAFDASGDVAAEYKLRGMPSSYLIGRDGKIYASHIGFREKDKMKLERVIKNLLSK
ncbi:hypothetical protein MNBD_GAMMA06-1604 [hydrothermal vent metagenome]|uniref:Thioredoxin domain-containing protein n=1 Tax=hydrothermal vent metagenome TaxID=652676 RepID=A0A3B0WHX6_9ZZZZ